MKRFGLSIVSLAVFASASFASDVTIEKVFDFNHPGPYKHPAAITELANGDLYIAYYGGSGEYSNDTAVYGSRLRKGGTVWSYPQVIADTPDVSEGNPVVWQAPDGIVWLFYVNNYGTTWSDAIVKAKISKDGAETWTDSFLLKLEQGSMVRGQPIVLNNGDYLLPMYHETGGDTEMTAPDSMSYFLRYDRKTKTWTETGRIKSETGNIQAQVVQFTDDHLVCYIRPGGNFEPSENRWTLRSESHDGGMTWSDAKNTTLKNPNSAIDFIRLQSGNLLLVYNDNMNDRTPLTVVISTDNDKTYPHRRDIGEGDNTFAYPYAIQSSDGKIHILYTTDERQTIMLASFDESAILNYKKN